MRRFVCLFVLQYLLVTCTGEWVKTIPYRFSLDLGLAFRRTGTDDVCSVCFGEDYCVQVDQARCEFYMETSSLVSGEDDIMGDSEENMPLKMAVDSILFDVAERGMVNFNECVPLVSRYTDCTKDNICLGCRTCDCDATGRWNCTETHKCRPDTLPLNVDHHTLIVVLENLKKFSKPSTRFRRSITQPLLDYDLITRAKLAEWLFGIPPLNIPETVLSTINESASEDKETLAEENKLEQHNDDNAVLLNLDAGLPSIFKESIFEETNVNRMKRWIMNNNTSNIIIDDFTDWLTELKQDVPTEMEAKSFDATVSTEATVNTKATVVVATTENDEVTTQEKTSTRENIEPEFLTFDEVLDNIAVENRNYTRRKPPLDMHSDAPIDFLYDDNAVDALEFLTTQNAVTDNPIDETTVTEALMKGYTEVVIDLLESAKDGIKLDDLITKDSIETMIKGNNDSEINFDNLNNIEDPETANVRKRKREIPVAINKTVAIVASNVNQTNVTTTTAFVNNTVETTTAHSNISHSVHRLVDSVVYPLNEVYNKVLKQINELHHIRQELLHFVRKHTDLDVKVTNVTVDNKVFPVYKLEDQHFLRADGNLSVLEQFALKLKRDVYEVIRDIVAIQKHYTSPSKMPEDLKFLIKAMKHYVHKQGIRSKKKSSKKNDTKPKSKIVSRRMMQSDVNDTNVAVTKRVINLIIEALELLDKDMPSTNALEPISRNAKKIMYRVIRQYYIDEFAQIGLRVYDPHYNLTNDLSNVGFKWNKISAEIEISAPENQLYLLKILHLIMSVDISRMNDALTLINFASTRRMVPVDEAVGNDIVSNIERGLQNLNRKVLVIIEKTMNNKKPRLRNLNNLSKQIKETNRKESFLKQVKGFLMNSKKDIMDLLRRKTPKSDIVKKIAGRKLDDLGKQRLNQLQNTMTKWQTHLNIIPSRNKRSAMDFDRIRRRIKNIIPKYLRGKLHPAIVKKDNKKKKAKTAHDSSVKKKSRISKTTLQASPKEILPRTTIKPKAAQTSAKHMTTTSTTQSTTTSSTTTPSTTVIQEEAKIE